LHQKIASAKDDFPAPLDLAALNRDQALVSQVELGVTETHEVVDRQVG
jgi:hypothetical protein